MKRFWSFFALLAIGLSCFAQAEAKIDRTDHDFGQVDKGVPVSYEFVVENTGDEPLIISGVSKPCGCQKASYTKEPIMPGKTGVITATYNAAKTGNFIKSFNVQHNGSAKNTMLTLKGEVRPREKVAKNEDPGL
jgi:hypothetical protein